MSEETKGAIHLVLQLLRKTLIEEGVSMGTAGEKLLFFDTATYLNTGKMDGFAVNINDLVKGGGQGE